MGVISGQVVAATSKRAIPGLVVVATATATRSTGGRVQGRHRRLGSVSTDARGRFVLDYPDGVSIPAEPGAEAEETSWDITVTVLGPNTADTTVLATATRSNAGPRESFVIRIPDAQLEAAGLPPRRPVRKDRPTSPDLAQLAAGKRSRLVAQLETRRMLRTEVDARLETFLSGLSEPSAQRRVRPGETVQAATARAVSDGVPEVAASRAQASAVIPDDELDRLRSQYGPGLSDIPEAELGRRVYPRKPKLTAPLVRIDPMWWCRKLVPVNDCVKILVPEDETVPEPDPQPEPDPGPQPPQPVPGEISDLVQRLTATMTSPEQSVLYGVRPGVSDVQGAVDSLTLRGGPADTPAVYDFAKLTIAFEPVWQELFDTNMLDTGRQLYEQFVELGLDPNAYLTESTFTGPHLNLDLNLSAGSATVVNPPPAVAAAFEITAAEYGALVAAGMDVKIQELADVVNGDITEEEIEEAIPFGGLFGLGDWDDVKKYIANARSQGERMIEFARSQLAQPDEFDHMHSLLAALKSQLKQPYRFNVYAADGHDRSVNFGVVTTFRQKWTPIAYQVGELVKTVPMAPKESRRYSKKLTTRVNRAEREVLNSLETRRTESSETARIETEIVRKAQQKTNFETTASGGFNIGVANATGTVSAGHDAAQESSEAKKEFRESVFKAAAEYKAERTLEVNVSDYTEFAGEEFGEISNPNDEISVTYLFYQLQRRYRIEEKLYKVQPVVLVAQEFPKPSTIDEDWIVSHDWILRRVILDDSFLPAMNYLASKVVGDEMALRELYQNVQQQRRVVDELKEELVATRKQMERRYRALEKSIKRRADAINADENEGFIEEVAETFYGEDDVSPEAMKVMEDAARDAYERAVKAERDALDRLQRETGNLTELTQTYAQQLGEHLNRRAQISRLQVHLKSNIVYYMQAIWAHEPPDQRYFRLRDVQVPRLVGTKTYSIEVDQDAIPLPPTWTKPHKLVAKVAIDAGNLQYDKLGDVADLDTLLGYKGNYMIFPLKQENALTDYMLTPYYDPFSGLQDPDRLADWTLHEFADYVCCIRKHMSKSRFDRILPGLIETYRRLRERAADDGELVVPTDSLYIEALPGAHPILEDFKLVHRAIDIKQAQADARSAELENVRLAARLLAGENEDPNVDKRIIIDGATPIVVDPES
ncbi:hypothetical protein Rhe02_60110 [Rhizocola hellebori]|uniref:Uncharacterized protein n=1 Tax=Rhizocola hellebori TaxID=1392758 RepID=A0A8J3VHZ7_9ACTN|nr:hypothetical protein [Rhizocola hellebori]GIH07944.1 hypothetical protein Rhe02_60110 [Rhizocola hellebori]